MEATRISLDQPATPGKPRRRWLQFSLRTLLIFVTLASLLCGLVVVPALKQRRIVEQIQADGGWVWYDHQKNIVEFNLGPKPSWLDRLIGQDFMYRATGVGAPPYHETGAVLRSAAQLPNLESIDATACDISDKDLAEIRGLKNLKELDLDLFGMAFSEGIQHEAERRDPRLRPAALSCLENLTGLERLSLEDRSCVTDAGMEHFEKMTALRSLDLRGTQVNAAGLAHLKCQVTLEELDLWGCSEIDDTAMRIVSNFKLLRVLRIGLSKVTDAGLAELTGLQSLKELDLQKCPITDAGMAHVAKLKSLRILSLYDTKISDAGLKQLEPLTQLDEINLNDTAVTKQGVEATAQHLHVGQWAIPQEWQDTVLVPAGQGIYGVPTR